MLTSPPPDSAAATNKGRFVTVCQQLLALAVVVAVLTPAADTISMDVRPAGPLGQAADGGDAYLRASAVPSRVPTAAVELEVTEYHLTAPADGRLAPGALRATARRTTAGGSEVTSDAVPVLGYGAVGVTWAHGEQVADDEIGIEVRTRRDGAWTAWSAMEYHDDHGPDPDSAEGQGARPGTDALLVGEVDRVQVRIGTDAAAPADLQLAVVDPGTASSTARQTPEIDTAALDGAPADTTGTTSADGDLELATAVTAPKPKIFSRAQWGANENLRDPGSLRYFEVHAGFVHHTVNANAYTRAQVPGIIRGIYAYHTQSRGWSDIGYNYLVDRFGRMWEGRFGGVDRPVVGAHTLGYNDDAFAMSAIGNFEEVRPSEAMVEAYGALFAWKLALHGVDASSSRQYVTSRYFPAVNGHRDADSTACPGQYLYNRIGDIRELAATTQRSWKGRELESNLTGTKHPDLIVRRRTDGRGFILPVVRVDGHFQVGKAVDTGLDLSDARTVLKAGDWDRDGFGDLIVRNEGDGTLYLHRGLGTGAFEAPVALAERFGGVTLLAAVGDVTGDGRPDLMGQPKRGVLRIWPGKGLRGVRKSYPASGTVTGNRQIPIGRWNGDGAPDVFLRNGDDLTIQLGNGPGGITDRKTLGLSVARYDWLVGVSDVGLKGHADVLARARSDGALWLLPGTRDGFNPRIKLGDGFSKYDLVG